MNFTEFATGLKIFFESYIYWCLSDPNFVYLIREKN